MRRTFASLLFGLFALVPGAPTRGDDDAARARDALLEGRILPLGHFQEWIQARYLGQILEAEIEEEDGAFVYELEWLTPAGNVIEFEFDAASGRLLEIEGRGISAARRAGPELP